MRSLPRAIRPATDDRSVLRHDVSIVVPCYNPGPVVLETVNRLAKVLAPITTSFEVVAVSDGSTDGSIELLDGLAEPWFQHIHYDRNRGKGYALRRGFAAGRSSVVGFIDADGDLPPEQFVDYLRALDELGADAVLGSKRHPESLLELPALRRVFSWGYQRIVRIFFRLDILDTQTGIKLFRRELIDAVLPVVREDGFALDLEIFVAARAAGFNRFVELPVILEHRYNSTVSNRTAGRMLLATGRIFWAARLSLRYARLISLPSGSIGSTGVGTQTQSSDL